MSSQRTLRILVIAALTACVTALGTWWQSGEPPAPWLQRIAFALVSIAALAALFDQTSRPRLVLRFLAALLALIAVIAFAADWTSARVDGAPDAAHGLLDHLTAFTPRLVTALNATVVNALGPVAWDPLLLSVLNLPAWVVFAVLALLAGFAGRPRRQVRIFAN